MPSVSGVVRNAANNFAQKLVRVHDRASGALIGWTTSNPTTGAYNFALTTDKEVYVVAHDYDGTSGDFYWDKVVLAMHMDDTGLTDVKGHAVTLNGSAARSATQSKFGGYSAYFGGSGSYLSIPSSSDFAYGTNDFTWACWIYPTSSTVGYVLDHGANGGTIQWASGKLVYYNAATGVGSTLYTTGFGTPTLNVWSHIAVVRSGGTTSLYLNGAKTTSGADGNSYSAQSLRIGEYGGGGYGFVGYIDDLIITNGVGRWLDTFVVPTTAFGEGAPGGTENAVILDRVVPA